MSKIIDEPNLERESSSGAVINTNIGAWKKHMARKHKDRIKDKQIANLESKLQRLEKLVVTYMEKDNDTTSP